MEKVGDDPSLWRRRELGDGAMRKKMDLGEMNI